MKGAILYILLPLCIENVKLVKKIRLFAKQDMTKLAKKIWHLCIKQLVCILPSVLFQFISRPQSCDTTVAMSHSFVCRNCRLKQSERNAIYIYCNSMPVYIFIYVITSHIFGFHFIYIIMSNCFMNYLILLLQTNTYSYRRHQLCLT